MVEKAQFKGIVSFTVQQIDFRSIEFDESNQLILLCECMNGMTRRNFTFFSLSRIEFSNSLGGCSLVPVDNL